MTRRLWMAASLLAAAATAWLYMGFGPDHLLWAWSRIMPPAAALPAAVPMARLADALLAGVVVAYLLGFVPLTISTWLQGAHLTSLARAAAAASSAGADEVAAARLAMLRSEAERSSPWQLLLQLDLASVDNAGPLTQRRAGIERATIVGDLVSHQSAASLFRGLAWICLCLGMFALVSQTISDLLGTDLLQRPSKSLELAATRGLLSAVTAIIIAALIDLGSRLAAAAIRQRAESLGRRFDRLCQSRRDFGDWDRDPVLTAEPIATLSVPAPATADNGSAERAAAMIERSHQQIAQRLDDALQNLAGSTLQPVLQEVSATLSGLSSQAGSMVETVDRRLAEQREDAREIAESAAAARDEIARQTALMLERSQLQIARSLDGALQRLAEESLRPMLQEISGRLAALGERAGDAIDTIDHRLGQQHDDQRQLAETVAAAREEAARQTALILERSQQEIAERVDGALQSLAGATVRPMLQEVSRLLELLSGQAGALVETLDQRLDEQRGDSRQFAEQAASGNQQLAASLAELQQAVIRSTAAIETRLERLIGSQEALAAVLPSAVAAPVAPQPAPPVANSEPAPVPGLPQSDIVARPTQADQDPLAILSRFLSDTGGPPAGAPSEVGAAAGSWADRLSELRRSSADLTNELPALRPDGPR